MSSFTTQEQLTLLTLSQSVGVIGHDIGNIAAIVGLRLAQFDLLKKKGLQVPEQVEKILDQMKGDMKRFESIIKGMSGLSSMTDKRQRAWCFVHDILELSQTIYPIAVEVSGVKNEHKVEVDCFQVAAALSLLYRFAENSLVDEMNLGNISCENSSQQKLVAIKGTVEQEGYQLAVELCHLPFSEQAIQTIFHAFINMPNSSTTGMETSVAYRIAQKNNISLNLENQNSHMCFLFSFKK